MKVFSFLIPIWIFSNLFLNVLRAFEEIGWYSFILNILSNVIKVVAIVLFIFLGMNSNSIIFSFLLGIVSILICAFLVCKYKLPQIFGDYKLDDKTKLKVKKDFFSYSFPVIFIGIFSFMFSWIDSLSIGYLQTTVDVGIYNVAILLAVLLRFTPELFTQLFYPMVTKELSKNNFNVVKSLRRQVLKWIIIINVPLFLVMFIFPSEIVGFLFGDEYLLASSALRILSIGFFFSSLGMIYGTLMGALGKSKTILLNIVSLSALNLVLNFILIPLYGINGAAISTTISWITLSITFFLEVTYFTKKAQAKSNIS